MASRRRSVPLLSHDLALATDGSPRPDRPATRPDQKETRHMQVTLKRPAEVSAAETAAWHAIQAADQAQASPFLCPEFAVAVGRQRPAARVAVLREGGELAGFFPFERRRLGVGVPVGAGLSDCQGLVMAPGTRWDTAGLLAS